MEELKKESPFLEIFNSQEEEERKREEEEKAQRERWDSLGKTIVNKVFSPGPPLTEEQSVQAVQDLVLAYPRIARSPDDPIKFIPDKQNFAIITFSLFSQPKPDLYGFIKVRGVFPTEKEATEAAQKIIIEHDSAHINHIVSVGRYARISNNREYARSLTTVDPEEKNFKQVTEEEEREKKKKAREIKKNIEKLLYEDEEEEKPGTLKYYTKKKVSSLTVRNWIQEAEKKLEHLKKIAEGYSETLSLLEKENPSHKERWLDCYNKKRKKSGLSVVSSEEEILSSFTSK